MQRKIFIKSSKDKCTKNSAGLITFKVLVFHIGQFSYNYENMSMLSSKLYFVPFFYQYSKKKYFTISVVGKLNGRVFVDLLHKGNFLKLYDIVSRTMLLKLCN